MTNDELLTDLYRMMTDIGKTLLESLDNSDYILGNEKVN